MGWNSHPILRAEKPRKPLGAVGGRRSTPDPAGDVIVHPILLADGKGSPTLHIAYTTETGVPRLVMLGIPASCSSCSDRLCDVFALPSDSRY